MKQTFATVINCMDGRIQQCVNEYVTNTQKAKHVDTITLAGPSKVISENTKKSMIDNLKFRIDISINTHGSKYIAIIGHFDCAGVEESDKAHMEYIIHSSKIIQEWYEDVTVEALWVSEDLKVVKLR